MTLLNHLTKAVTGAPLWVWPLLIYVIIVGIKRSKKRTIWIPWFTLLLLSIIKKNYLFSVFFFLGGLIGVGLALTEKIKIIKKDYMIELDGSYQPLILFLLLFLMKFLSAYLAVVFPEEAGSFVLAQRALTWTIIGLFYGKALGYTIQFLKN